MSANFCILLIFFSIVARSTHSLITRIEWATSGKKIYVFLRKTCLMRNNHRTTIWYTGPPLHIRIFQRSCTIIKTVNFPVKKRLIYNFSSINNSEGIIIFFTLSSLQHLSGLSDRLYENINR